MSKERGRPARLEVGMEVVRIPQSLYEADGKGKGERRPMRGRVVYIHPKVFRGWRYSHEFFGNERTANGADPF